ncbi:hypothetical protein [Pseudomonas turukhanskensis]|uniref:Uncharacterized protein n=1 Tax=Pseudomonas turukhanskensis TaxID=1806536 RepID=A0A9W6K567_9PSED|nr:hypothetical protein [Pseudomonas turukhanskensis]GLK88461.1 hypothetical protein GCM10017655_15230 [Pseudomonas turukhanskensis]
MARIGEDPSITAAVEAILATLAEVADALTPVIGEHGVAALYQRSVFLCASRYPHLSDLPGKTTNLAIGLDLAPLRSALLLHDCDAIRSCGSDLLKTLYQLLTSLIGASLSERLLRCAWENSLCGLPPQDTLI